MCGSLKYNDKNTKRGEPIPVFNPVLKKLGKAIWDGFAQKEHEDWWAKMGQAVPVDILIDSFIEGNLTFQIPEGAIVQGVGLCKDVFVSGRAAGRAKQVKVLTRAPLSAFEAKIHKRWPVVATKHGAVYTFTHKDTIQGRVQLELFKGGMNVKR